MYRKYAMLVAVVLAFTAMPAQAQLDDLFDEGGGKGKSEFDDVVKAAAAIEPKEAKRGQSAVFKITIKLAEGWHTYPVQQIPGAFNPSATNSYTFANSPAIVWVGKLKEPAPKEVPLEGGGKQGEYERELNVERSFVVRSDAKPGLIQIEAVPVILVCVRKGKEERCLIPTEVKLSAPLTILDASVPIDPQYAKEVEAATQGSTTEGPPTNGGSSTASPKSEPEPEKLGVRAEMPRTTQDLIDFYKGLIQSLVSQTTPEQSEDSGLLAFILAGVFWGAVSLATPCVFPMIPITVSFFIKQAEKEHHKPLTLALVYCGTIVVVLTIAAMVLLSAFRAASINPLTNILIGILFIFFTLSLFGLFEIELSSRWQLAFFLLFFSGLFAIIIYESRASWLPSPMWQIGVGLIGLIDLVVLSALIFRHGEMNLAMYTASRQDQGGVVGTMFMALTFTIISFACVAPFLGAFGGTAAGSTIGFWHRLLGGLSFSITFASPFFLLALFPSALKKLPKSGSWMNSVKVVMGFLELAAALKFLRQGELVLVPVPQIFTFDLVLGLWIGLCILCGLYLLNFYRLPHDTPAEHLSVPRLLLAACFLGLAFYLLPALFRVDAKGDKQDPGGAVYDWLNAFLLPDPSSDKQTLPWTGNLQLALEKAREKHRLVFIDFTGETCTNCKLNEKNIFPLDRINQALRQFELVQLYTDKVPNEFYPPSILTQLKGGAGRQRDDARVNLQFQRRAFGTEQLPLYVILDPNSTGQVTVVGVYSEGLINDENAFARFLQEPLERNGRLVSR